MTQTYFSKFPIIEYANTFVRDLTRRVVLPIDQRQQVTAFYPYDLKHDQRSDVLAYNYYADTDADWLIYLTNGIIDPYYGWYLNYDNFNASLIDKYGNLIDPQQRIKYWQTNWADDELNLTTSGYNALTPPLQKYWTPVWGSDNQVIFYQRNQTDWYMSTNQIWTVQVANNQAFTPTSLVLSNTNLGVIEGSGEIIGQANDGITVQIKDIQGTFSLSSDLVLFDNTTINSDISAVSITQINIPLSEAVYWTPTTYFTWEQIQNEANKSLMLVDKQYLNQIATTLKTNLNANSGAVT